MLAPWDMCRTVKKSKHNEYLAKQIQIWGLLLILFDVRNVENCINYLIEKIIKMHEIYPPFPNFFSWWLTIWLDKVGFLQTRIADKKRKREPFQNLPCSSLLCSTLPYPTLLYWTPAWGFTELGELEEDNQVARSMVEKCLGSRGTNSGSSEQRKKSKKHGEEIK